MKIKVRDILDLIICCQYVQIWVNGDIYEFPVCELPREVKDMVVETIDDPCCYAEPHPLCLNLLVDENFDNYEEFKNTNKEYLFD